MRTVYGYAAVWNKHSNILNERGRRFAELLLPHCMDEVLASTPDVKAYFCHDRSLVIGSTAANTLRLAIDNYGLRFELDLPDSPNGTNVFEAVKRQDVRGCSFRFSTSPRNEVWTRLSSELWEKTITKITSLPEISIETTPAYPHTTVSIEPPRPPDARLLLMMMKQKQVEAEL